MTSTPLDTDTTLFTDLMSECAPEYDEGVIYVLDYRSEHEMLSNKTQAFFKIEDGSVFVLYDVDVTITKDGAVNKIVAETSDGSKFVGPSGCGCGRNHPVPVDKGDVVTVKTGEFRVLPV